MIVYILCKKYNGSYRGTFTTTGLYCAEAPDANTTADWSKAQQLTTSPNDKVTLAERKLQDSSYSPSPNDKEVKMGN